jgi:hypothetical protein
MIKKQKRVFLLVAALLLIFLTAFFVSAQNNTKDDIDKAYECLETEIEDKGCDALSIEEKAFSLLSVGKCKSDLLDEQHDDGHWDRDLRKTAIAILALERVGSDTEDAEEWVLQQKQIPQDLIWYLEIDTDEASNCEINGKDISIGEDKKISGSAGTCFSLAQNNYWLEIDEDCYDTNFTIICDKDFISTLLYRKKTSSTIHVSSQTKSAPAEGTTKHRVNAFCFSRTNNCDYEGSLWTTLALAKTGRDVSSFLPYLVAMAEENEKYFPPTFLYMITDYDEYFSEIVDKQKNDYWELTGSPYHKFYDTSLALISLYGLDAEQAETAKEWLIDVQGTSGCWHNNNIRDTAFILYAAWPRHVSVSNGGGGDIDYCTDYDYFCVSPLECSQDDILDSYHCSGSSVCCRTESEEQTCDDKGGIICSVDQTCTSAVVIASDTTNCCLGSCIAQKSETTECEEQNYECRYSCLEGEEEKVYSCNSGKVCCAPGDNGGGGWIWIIILLLILIILTVLAIIYRDHLKIWFFKLKNKLQKKRTDKEKSGQGPQGPGKPGPRPPGPPSQMQQRPRFRPRRILPKSFRTPPKRLPQKPQSKTDKELDETLKKLKEMSK